MRENVSLAPFTTLGIGGLARYFIRATSEKTVLEAVAFAHEKNLPVLVLGGGSNLVVADAGFPGVVLRIEIAGLEWFGDDGTVRLTAGSGEDWDGVVAQAVERNLYGVECLSGIPGSVGGTPVQNVGAYGQEISETLVRLRALDRESGKIVELDRSDCGFSYRTSIFNTIARDRYIVLGVTYALQRTGKPAIHYPDLRREFENQPEPALSAVREAVRRVRARKSMLLQAGDPDCRSAGSFFKNPIVTAEKLAEIEMTAGQQLPRYPAAHGRIKTAAAWLIEHAGVSKGYAMGPVAVSSKHTLALINKGGATAADLLALARDIRNRVENRFGVRLMVEPVLAGFDRSVTVEFGG